MIDNLLELQMSYLQCCINYTKKIRGTSSNWTQMGLKTRILGSKMKVYQKHLIF